MSSSNLLKATIKETLSYLNNKVNNKANDSSVVKLSGDQFIDGDKTFNGSLFATTPNDSENSERVATTEFVKNLLQNASTRNIGEIVYSTIPLTDAGLHLLDGSVISGNGIYSEFVSYIAQLDQTANYFCTEEEWQTSVSSYGVCGKFVYDSENNTVRLPKITGFIEGTVDLSALGSLVEAGLPNITGTFGNCEEQSAIISGVFTREGTDGGAAPGAEGSENGGFNIYMDASRANAIYGRSNTVQPQSVKAFVYIVLTNAQKTEINLNINEITNDLNAKVDRNELQEVYCVVDSYSNGNSWYRIYSDGWCEQGSFISMYSSGTIINLMYSYVNTDYCVYLTFGGTSARADVPAVYAKTQSNFRVVHGAGLNSEFGLYWRTCGYLNS